MRGRIVAGVVSGLLSALAVSAQTEPSFEVVSVKVNLNADAPEAISLAPDGSVRFTGFHLRTLIARAYQSEVLQRFDQIIGGPSWIGVDRFDVVGKVSAQDSQGAMTRLPERLRAVLRDRFRLRAHTDTRSMPAFALVVSGRDRQPGPQFRQSTVDCPTAAAPASDADPDRWCGIRLTSGVIIGRGVPTGQLAGYLSGIAAVDRHVTDRTALTGRYDFRLEDSPAFLEPGGAGPSLFTALTEQLGLTLQAETVPLPVLIIDSVEKPTPD